MRRMMHAMAIFLISATVAQAQSKVRPITPPPESESALSVGAEFEPEQASDSESLKISTNAPADTAIQSNSPAQVAMHGTEFIPYGSDRPYSQLAIFMNCTQGSPNLWNSFACERAALVAKINHHVDGQCGCSKCRTHLHATASGPCGGEACNSGCSDKKVAGKVNRYRQPFSTLHAQRSDSCGDSCATGCAAENCSSCPTGEAGVNHPSSAHRAIPTLLAKPPRDRLAAPDVGGPRSTILRPIATTGIETRR